MTPQEDVPEPGKDEDEFYYSLGHTSASDSDPFNGFAIGAVIGALACAPFGLLAGFFFIITVPLCAIIGAVIGGPGVFAFNSFVRDFLTRQQK